MRCVFPHALAGGVRKIDARPDKRPVMRAMDALGDEWSIQSHGFWVLKVAFGI